MRITSRNLLIAALFAILTAALFAAPSPARAMCIYNNTTYPISATIKWLGGTEWKIGPTHHRCTNGTGGYAIISVLDPFRKWIISTDVGMEVDDHGWMSAYKKHDGKWKVESKDRHGSVKKTDYMRTLPGIELQTTDGQPLAR